MIKRCFLLMLSTVSLAVLAQMKQFTLDDLIPGGTTYSSLQPTSLNVTWWGNQLLKPEEKVCSLRNKKGEWQTLFTLEELHAAMEQAGWNTSLIRSLTSARFDQSEEPVACFRSAKYVLLYNWKDRKIIGGRQFDTAVTDADYQWSQQRLAYNSSQNLFVANIGSTANALQVSRNGSHDLVYGQSVHRNEFGITKGTYWSPDGSLLCFYRMDQSMVPDYPLIDISTRIATVAPTKYPMAGEASHRVSVGVFNVNTQQTVWLQTGDNLDQYFTGITWSPDSRKIFLYQLNRDQNHLRLWQFDATTGAREQQLYEEKHEKYVEPEGGVYFLPWDADKLIYKSEKDGFNHLYLYSIKEGRTLKQLTDQRVGVVLQLLGFNKATRSLIISATGTETLRHNLFRVPIDKGEPKLLGAAEGVHNARLSADGSMLIDTWSSPSVPRQVDLIHTANGRIETLHQSDNPWKEYDVPSITSGTIKAADGTTDLYYRLIKPTHFDPNKKYPAVVYVYGGPHARLVLGSWNYMARGWELYMAQLGYVVFVLDNRGSDERGRDFENVTFRQLGTEEMRDQMKGVDFLRSLPYVDANRLGVHGWSYGGFMTTNLMLTHNDVFKCGVAGGPVIDWSYYEVMYGERYMDTPQSNPEGYRNNNLTLRAADLKGRLLIIFGYNDPVCVPQHTLSFIRACETAGTHPDLLTYPGAEHNMVGKDRVHLHEHITRYFEDHLKPLTSK